MARGAPQHCGCGSCGDIVVTVIEKGVDPRPRCPRCSQVLTSPSPVLRQRTRSHHRSQGMSIHPAPAVTSHPVPWGATTATAPVGVQWGCHTRLGATTHFGHGWAWGHPWSLSVSMAKGPGGEQGHWTRRGHRGDTPKPHGQWVSSPIVPVLSVPRSVPTHTHTGLCHQVSPGMSPLHAECHQWLKGPVWPPVLRSAVIWVAL